VYAFPEILPYQDVCVKTTNSDINLRNSIFCRVRYHHYQHNNYVRLVLTVGKLTLNHNGLLLGVCLTPNSLFFINVIRVWYLVGGSESKRISHTSVLFISNKMVLYVLKLLYK